MESEVIDLPTPKILKFKLEEEILDHLSKLIAKYDNGKHQWMLIDENRRFRNQVLSKVINQYINTYNVPFNPKTTFRHSFTFQRFWCNRMSKGEYQALHNHDAVFSFIIWLKIPFSCKKERELINSMHPEPGSVSFVYSDITGTHKKHSFLLDESFDGTMLFFPSDLFHVVNPFFASDGFRISIAGDIALNSLNPVEALDTGMTLGSMNSQEFLTS